MKIPEELNSLSSKFFCYITWLLYQLIRRDTERLANEAFTSNSIVSLKQKLNGLKITNCIVAFENVLLTTDSNNRLTTSNNFEFFGSKKGIIFKKN